MSTFLTLTPQDSLVARDSRPFGAGQGHRMRSLPWLLPSVVAGSLRTALAKAAGVDFSDTIPERLRQIAVAGVFPVHRGELYLPEPKDAVAEPDDRGNAIKVLHRVQPQPLLGGCDLPAAGLQPVMLSEAQAAQDFKPGDVPAWWPFGKYTDWLLAQDVALDTSLLNGPRQEIRDHVCLDPQRGAASEGLIFTSAELIVAHLPRFGVRCNDRTLAFEDRFAQVTLTARVDVPPSETQLQVTDQFQLWHPLGGERRMVHWQRSQATVAGWQCPLKVRQALESATKVRMVLATPAIFRWGWKPGWLDDQLEGAPPGSSAQLQLVGVCNHRWKAVSGWSLAPPRGPKPTRRMVPAGSVYFFTCQAGAARSLADRWLQPVSDDEQEQRDGFGLAVWGIW